MKEFTPARLRSFRRRLNEWYRVNHRDLPWRGNRDPYRIWISEIMLQQTRVAAVIPYYERFLIRFPDVASLAAASDDDLLGAWAGLGYYSRARNLRAAARKVAASGSFPDTYEAIRKLPGIGPYTAAAVSSICFKIPCAVLDGNVMRVIARLTQDKGNILSASTRNRMLNTAQNLLDNGNPDIHNQAMMELGATLCVPCAPKCEFCPVSSFCSARSAGLESELPIKTHRDGVSRTRRTLLLVVRNGNILLWRRAANAALLGGFWELPEPHQLPEAKTDKLLHKFSHRITNHIYDFHVVSARTTQVLPLTIQCVPLEKLPALPLSTVTRKALQYMRLFPDIAKT